MVTKIVEYIVHSFRARILRADWLSDLSRRLSLEKLDAVSQNVAYPDELFDNSYINDLYSTVCTCAHILVLQNTCSYCILKNPTLEKSNLGKFGRRAQYIGMRNYMTSYPLNYEYSFTGRTEMLICPCSLLGDIAWSWVWDSDDSHANELLQL